MKETSLEAYEGVKPKIKDHHKTIINTLKLLHKGTSRDISNQSGMNYHAVSRRMSELRRDDIVIEGGTTIDNTSKKRVTLWELKQ